MATTSFEKPGSSAQRQEFYQRLKTKNAAPLWEVFGDIIPREPHTSCLPVLWRYQEFRSLLMEAGGLITAQEAERRVLILENPGFRGASKITGSLYAGLQLVLPGEITPSHRHATSALRFILEGSGAYTTVEGEQITMHPGDFILTPCWTAHEHGNPTDEPVVWLDGLDIPIVNIFDSSFATRDVTGPRPAGLPKLPSVFSYAYAPHRETLERRRRTGPLDACHGVKLSYADPATGGDIMPTIGAFLQLLPSGFRGTKYRATDATVYCVVEGRGRSQIGETVLNWEPRDVFVAPSWYPVSHEAQGDAVLFSFSDRPAQKAFGLWREQAPIS
jgi:gentisate 1,2-dioxygenase